MEFNMDIYKKNLKALSVHRPGLKKRVEQAQFPDWIEFIPKNGWYSGVFKFKEDKRKY